MAALVPHFHLVRWGGSDVTGDREVEGWSIAFQWLGLMIEVAGGRVR